MNKKEIIKYLKNSISEKGNYSYSLPIETTKLTIRYIEDLEQRIDKAIEILNYVNDIKTKYTNYNIKEKDYIDKLLQILKGEE